MSGSEINASDNLIYKFHVTDVNRRKLGGSTNLTPVVALTCITNPLLSMVDIPLGMLKGWLDIAPFDDQRVLYQEIPQEELERMLAVKKSKRRKLVVDTSESTVHLGDDDADVVIGDVIGDVVGDGADAVADYRYEYSDEEEDDMPTTGFTMIDSIIEARRAFDVEDAEPLNVKPIPEPPEADDKTVEETQWTRCVHDDVPFDDPEGFTQATRPSQATFDHSSSPLTLFLHLMPHSFWEHIARCSDKKRRALLDHSDGEDSPTVGTPRRNDQKYMRKPIVAARVFAFMLVLILNMLQPFAGGMANHWRTDSTFIRRAGTVSMVMTRDEFRTIARCLCLYEPGSLDAGDKFTKIRYVIDFLNKSFQKAIRLGPFVSFDEATFASRSTYIPARQYNPFKPKKFGLKIFMLCEAVIGYCFSFEIYQGKLWDIIRFLGRFV